MTSVGHHAESTVHRRRLQAEQLIPIKNRTVCTTQYTGRKDVHSILMARIPSRCATHTLPRAKRGPHFLVIVPSCVSHIHAHPQRLIGIPNRESTRQMCVVVFLSMDFVFKPIATPFGIDSEINARGKSRERSVIYAAYLTKYFHCTIYRMSTLA